MFTKLDRRGFVNATDYEILKAVYLNRYLSQRNLAKLTGFSLGKINRSLNELKRSDYLDDDFQPTSSTDALVESLKPNSAIILAAGAGLRMLPLCRDLPKALLEVKGEILIERLIRQLHAKDITEIYVVVGYMKEKFEYLIDKYNVTLIVNTQFSIHNNFYSLSLVSHKLSNSYIVPCDIYCEDNPFSHIETYSWYMVTNEPSLTSDLIANRNGELVVVNSNRGGNQQIGIAYISNLKSKQLISNLSSSQCADNYNCFWEKAAISNKKSIFSAKVVDSTRFFEINTYDDLIHCDIHSRSLNSEYIDIICNSLNIKREDISHIKAQKAGMTNRSFLFTCNNEQYIFRIPGEGTDQLINRQQEFEVYQQIQDKNICDEIIYINPKNGYKITKFIKQARNCNPDSMNEVKKCMNMLRNFHELDLSVNHNFDIFEQIIYYEKLRSRNSVYSDYEKTKDKIYELKTYIDNLEKTYCLCHIDSVCDNFIFSNDKIYLIDWEYAGMQDPHVDIAMFAIYALYDKTQIDQLIDFYFRNNCNKKTRLKIYCYIAACGLLWSNWCEYKATLGETFGEYSLRQYRYAKDYYQYFKEGISNE